MGVGDGSVLRDILKPPEKPRRLKRAASIAGDMAVMAIGVGAIVLVCWGLVGFVAGLFG